MKEQASPLDAFRLDGRVAAITGGARGIGFATAQLFTAAGARTVLLDIDGAAAAEAATTLGPLASAMQIDVSVEADVNRVFDEIASTCGGLDVLVNNAGVMLLGTIVGADPEDWRRMLDTNVLGLLYMTHAAVEGMVEQGSGDIVNISSVAGRTARKGAGVYNASKWAVNAFSESLRQEVTGRGVRISLVEPGAVTTELNTHITQPEAKAASQRMHETIRALQADDIARAVVYLVSQPPHVAINEMLIRPTDQER
jgi:NADP-dependent 3-hydroxy acid dehydrogenase YdfG